MFIDTQISAFIKKMNDKLSDNKLQVVNYRRKKPQC
jgi:hypothetical protein